MLYFKMFFFLDLFSNVKLNLLILSLYKYVRGNKSLNIDLMPKQLILKLR